MITKLNYTFDDGGGIGKLGLTPTEDVCWPLEEVRLAKPPAPTCPVIFFF